MATRVARLQHGLSLLLARRGLWMQRPPIASGQTSHYRAYPARRCNADNPRGETPTPNPLSSRARSQFGIALARTPSIRAPRFSSALGELRPDAQRCTGLRRSLGGPVAFRVPENEPHAHEFDDSATSAQKKVSRLKGDPVLLNRPAFGIAVEERSPRPLPQMAPKKGPTPNWWRRGWASGVFLKFPSSQILRS